MRLQLVRSVTKNRLYSGALCHRSVKHPRKCNFTVALKEHTAGPAPISATLNQRINMWARLQYGLLSMSDKSAQSRTKFLLRP